MAWNINNHGECHGTPSNSKGGMVASGVELLFGRAAIALGAADGYLSRNSRAYRTSNERRKEGAEIDTTVEDRVSPLSTMLVSCVKLSDLYCSVGFECAIPAICNKRP